MSPDRCASSCVAVRLLGRPKPTAPCSQPTHDKTLVSENAVCSLNHSSVCQTCICIWVYAPCESGSVAISNGYLFLLLLLLLLQTTVQGVRLLFYLLTSRRKSYLIINQLRSRFTKTASQGQSSDFIAPVP